MEDQALFEGRNNYVAQLSKDLQAEFPEITGFSVRNLFYIRRFYQFYSDSSVQQLVRLNETEDRADSVQQVVALNETKEKTGSVQQPVALNETKEKTGSSQQPVAPGDGDSVQQPVGLNLPIYSVPWGHHVLILDKVKDVEAAMFYLQQTIEYNWSRAILTLQIEKELNKTIQK